MRSLWLYRLNRKPKHVSISRVGGEHGFYRHETGDFEQQLSRRENEWAKLLEKLLKDKRLYGSDRVEFARFIGVMSTRGRYFYDMTHTIASYVDEYISLRARDSDDAQSIRKQLTASNLLPSQITKEWTLTEALETGNDYIPLLYEQMNWLVLVASEGDYVVTCDTPVSLTDPREPVFTKTGMRYSPDAEFTLPLDRQHVLLGSRRRNEGMLNERGFAFRQINRRSIRRAYKAVYADLNSQGLASLVNDQLRSEPFSIHKEKLFADIDSVRKMWG